MRLSQYPETPEHREISRVSAPIQRLPTDRWDLSEEASVVLRRGALEGGGVYVRIDYSGGVMWQDLAPVLHLDVNLVDPVSKAEVASLKLGEFPMSSTETGTFVVELVSCPGVEGTAVVENLSFEDSTGHDYHLRWYRARFMSPKGDVSDPGEGAPSFELRTGYVFRNRANAKTYVAASHEGSPECQTWVLCANPKTPHMDEWLDRKYFPAFSELGTHLVLFLEYAVPPEAWIGGHHHETEEIYYVLRGRGTYMCDGEERTVEAGDTTLIHPGSWHALKAGPEGLDFLVIEADPKTPVVNE